MTISPTLQVIISDKDYCQITSNTSYQYANKNLKGEFFWESIKIDFKS